MSWTLNQIELKSSHYGTEDMFFGRAFYPDGTSEEEYHFLDRLNSYVQRFCGTGRIGFELWFGDTQPRESVVLTDEIWYRKGKKFDLIEKMFSTGGNVFQKKKVMSKWLRRMKGLKRRNQSVNTGYPLNGLKMSGVEGLKTEKKKPVLAKPVVVRGPITVPSPIVNISTVM